jgi:TIR domain/Pentapeptide repeats (8 copies)
MANEEHLAILKRDVDVWNRWRSENRQVVPNLIGANLTNLKLAAADLSVADIPGANLSCVDLALTNLSGANLSRANLEGAKLRATGLFGANLSGAHLEGADFSDCRMLMTTFGNNDLRAVSGLATVRHNGPSTIGIDTIYRSKGKIPEVFLRGAGVPEEFITYMKSQVANPIEFYSCFISYSTKDQEFAERLHGDLQNKNVRCWFAPHDVQGGKKLQEQIDEAIRVHEKVLLILSAESMSSEWVKTEIAKARKREVREKKQVLFPVRLVAFEAIRDWECFDADSGKDSAREIREYFIPDFSEWKNHDAYKKAFERLLGDLKEGEKKVEG